MKKKLLLRWTDRVIIYITGDFTKYSRNTQKRRKNNKAYVSSQQECYHSITFYSSFAQHKSTVQSSGHLSLLLRLSSSIFSDSPTITSSSLFQELHFQIHFSINSSHQWLILQRNMSTF